MTTLGSQQAQELVFLRLDFNRLAQEVVSIRQAMRRLEQWQDTMDMTLKSTSENN